MSRSQPATEQELRDSFDALIAGPPADNGGMPTETGLDTQTVAAIERVWAAAPTPPPALLAAARHELDMQLDGSHAREADARNRAIFADALGGSDDSPVPAV